MIILLICRIPNNGPSEHTFDFKINAKSNVLIKGSTNINSFECSFLELYNVDSIHAKGSLVGPVMWLDGVNFDLKVDGFDCGSGLMTNEFNSTLKKDEFPYIKMQIQRIVFNKVEDFTKTYATVKFFLRVKAAGKYKHYEINTYRKLINEKQASFKGLFEIDMNDFGVVPPSHAFGTIKVSSKLEIEYDFVLDRTIKK